MELSYLRGCHFTEQEGKSQACSALQISQESQEDPCHMVACSQVRPLPFADPLAQDGDEEGRSEGQEKRESIGEEDCSHPGAAQVKPETKPCSQAVPILAALSNSSRSMSPAPAWTRHGN